MGKEEDLINIKPNPEIKTVTLQKYRLITDEATRMSRHQINGCKDCEQNISKIIKTIKNPTNTIINQ